MFLLETAIIGEDSQSFNVSKMGAKAICSSIQNESLKEIPSKRSIMHYIDIIIVKRILN